VVTYGDGKLFEERRQIMEEMGKLYRDLRDQYGEHIQLEILDPRNLISFVMILVREKYKRGLSWLTVMRSLTKGLHTMAVLVNGEIVCVGRIPKVTDVKPYLKQAIMDLKS
jgi:hypothetical protein